MSRRLNALVIGNAAYEAVKELKNPVNDAEDVCRKLEACGFTIIRSIDSDHAAMDRGLKRFQRVLKESDVGLFFFAGHGMQIDGENYLAAVDTDGTDEIAAKHSSLALNRVIEVMEKSGCSTSIIVLDACRNNPFERAWTRSIKSRGLAPVYAPRGTLIAYATSPGQTASDGRGRNGTYTAALLQHLATPDCSIEAMFKRVRNTLSAATKGKQISWEHTSLAGEFFFNLSLGMRIDLYAETALSDSLFVLDEAKASHRVIRELQSSTWPRQNPAVEGFKPGQVYLHYDPYTQRQRGDEQFLARQRMDFLLMLEQGVRIVIETDGRHHYATQDSLEPDKYIASAQRYAEMVAEDRRLRLMGYEVYRFGGYEFPDVDLEQRKVGRLAQQCVADFFDRLLARHSVL